MHTIARLSGMTLTTTPGDDAKRKHLKHLRLKNRAPSTIRHRSESLDRLQKQIPVPILDATADHLYEWRAGLNLKPATVSVYLSHIRSFYDWAMGEGLIESNPAAAAPVPKLPARVPRPIAEQDLMFALNSATHQIAVRPWIVLAGWCGLRCAEIAGLRVENIRLHDDPPVIIVSAESAKGGRERIIPLSRFVIDELMAFHLPLSGYAFPDANGQMRKDVSKVGNAHLTGCGTRSTMHKLRTRFATQLAWATHDPQVVQELMGHATLATTAGYMAFSKTAAVAAVAALPVPGELPPMLEAS